MGISNYSVCVIASLSWNGFLTLDDISTVQLCYVGCPDDSLFHTSPSLQSSLYMESSQNFKCFQVCESHFIHSGLRYYTPETNGWNPKSWRFGSDESHVQRGDGFRCQPLVFRGCKFPPTNYIFFTHRLRQIPKLSLSAQRMAWELNFFFGGGLSRRARGRTQVMCRKDDNEGKFQEIHLPRFNVVFLLGKFLVLSTLLRCVG